MATDYSTRDERTRYDSIEDYRHDRDRDRDRDRNREREYGRERERERERDYRGQSERGILERAGDEMRSWFGDEEAERRRRRDQFDSERHERQGGYESRPASSDDVRASHVMTRNVTTVMPYDHIEHAARLMRDCDCGALPVVNRDGRLIGMVTDRDIVVRLVARVEDIRRAVVADCMTSETFACHANDRLEVCLREMARRKVRRLPVVGDDNRVIGIITQADIARHADAWQGRGRRRQFTDTVSEISEPPHNAYR